MRQRPREVHEGDPLYRREEGGGNAEADREWVCGIGQVGHHPSVTLRIAVET